MVTAEMMPSIMSGSLIRDTPPWARISAGTRSSAITATAPAPSAMRACSGVTTSMMTPPLSISAMPRLTRAVPVRPLPLCAALSTATSIVDVSSFSAVPVQCNGPPPANFLKTPGATGSADGGVEQFLGGGFGRHGDVRIAIHPGGQPAAVVQQLQLPSQPGRVRGAGFAGEGGE